ncbi:6440_t:CDS:1 [Scutellospora calospora]|uniref:6440_t:CDS:1 n=1 Tax=Scutellospora calospora TaxID=85575 RepID=A0ACA9JU33_9GLOM|nr:6440_t:CDS:1 [Scutellospora calospora]
MAIINAYRIIRILELTKEHKEFRYELVWNLINFANDTGVQLRNSLKNSKEIELGEETKRPKVMKYFELSDKWLVPGNYLVEWRDQCEACRWCTWLAHEDKLDMNRKSLHQSSYWCTACNEPLCCNNNQNCFLQFHTVNNAEI